jgi:hypothetical protein
MTSVLICLIISPASGEGQLKSGFDQEGIFNNRLRIEYEFIRISLLASLSVEELKYIEADLISPELSIGRIYPKGLVREMYNPDGVSPSASVLTETSAVSISDSMSRSSRYGAVFSADSDLDFNAWLFRANSGEISAGLMLDSLSLLDVQGFCSDLNIFMNLSGYDGNSFSEWFDSEAVNPPQAGLNPAAELCYSSSPSEGSGRRLMKYSGDAFSIKASLLAAASCPQYTEHGYLLRFLASAGNKTAACTALVQAASPEYMTPSGNPSAFALINGISLAACFETTVLDIAVSADYCLKRKQYEVIPSRYLSQIQTFSAGVKLFFGIFLFSAEAVYNDCFETTGELIQKESLDAGLEAETEHICVELNYRARSEQFDNCLSSQSGGYAAAVKIRMNMLQIGLGCDYSSTGFKFDTDFTINTEYYRLHCGLEIEDPRAEGFYINFETR